MSIFGHKEIARLKKELETSSKRNEVLQSEVAEFKEKYSRYFSALNQSNKEIENYKSELLKANTETQDYKRKYAELLANTPEFTTLGQISLDATIEELTSLKEKCQDYENRLHAANSAIEKLKCCICDYQGQINEMEKEHNNLVNSICGSSDNDCEDNSSNTKDPLYKIIDGVRTKPKLMSAIYTSKRDFFSLCEYKMYYLLENLLYDYRDEFGDLAVFSKIRLADIVGLFEENYNTGERSFCDCIEKNPNKKSVCELIDRFMPNFNNNDYKRAFLFPLLRSHIDFLICDQNSDASKPILAIELNGEEHNKDSKKPDWKRIHNDNFKKSLFNSQNSAMKIRLITVKNEELDNEDILSQKIYNIIEKCLGCEYVDNSSAISLVAGRKWNGKIYRNKIYVDGSPVQITDEQASELRNYIKNKDKL